MPDTAALSQNRYRWIRMYWNHRTGLMARLGCYKTEVQVIGLGLKVIWLSPVVSAAVPSTARRSVGDQHYCICAIWAPSQPGGLHP